MQRAQVNTVRRHRDGVSAVNLYLLHGHGDKKNLVNSLIFLYHEFGFDVGEWGAVFIIWTPGSGHKEASDGKHGEAHVLSVGSLFITAFYRHEGL